MEGNSLELFDFSINNSNIKSILLGGNEIVPKGIPNWDFIKCTHLREKGVYVENYTRIDDVGGY